MQDFEYILLRKEILDGQDAWLLDKYENDLQCLQPELQRLQEYLNIMDDH